MKTIKILFAALLSATVLLALTYYALLQEEKKLEYQHKQFIKQQQALDNAREMLWENNDGY